MAWTEKRKAEDGSTQFRLRDRIGVKRITVIANAGAWKAIADVAKVNYEKAIAQGFSFTPPTTVAAIEEFLKAKAEGREVNTLARRLPITEMCDTYLKLHGPSLKGGVSDHYRSAYHGIALRMEQIKRFWPKKFADEVGMLDVRDFLGQFQTIGTKMRWIVVLGHMFRIFAVWNDEETVKINGPVRLPAKNPVTRWRSEMKPHEKREIPDNRVLSHAEWEKLCLCLKPRALAISEVALRRFLRLSDIKKISHRAVEHGHIKGVQSKTGDIFKVPVIAEHNQKYDFTNFVREFKDAQVKAGLDYPADHALHFSPKDLRRTGATWYYNETKDLRGVQKMLGHRKLSTTERYLNITDADVVQVASTMDRLAKINGLDGSRTRPTTLTGSCANRYTTRPKNFPTAPPVSQGL